MGKSITFFTCGGLEEPSAVGRYLPLAKELAGRGFQVNYLALHPDLRSVSERRIARDGIHVYFVGQMHVLKRGDRKFYFGVWQLLMVVLASTFNMIRTALSLNSDVLYCFKPQPINGFAALVVKFIQRKPLLLDCDDYEAALNRLSRFQKKIFVLFEDNLPRFAQKVTFHTMFLKERYLRMGFPSEKFVLLPNGVDAQRFENIALPKVEELRRQLNLEGRRVILYCGSLSLKSGHAIDLLLEAFAMIRQQIPDAVLLMVGGGEDIDMLKQRAETNSKDAVIFTGKVAPEWIPYYIKLAQVSVDPVKDELVNKGRSPLKVFESMALGVPVVTSDIGDRKLIIENDRAGLLVRIGDAQALAQGCIRILSDPQLAQRMSEEALRIIWKYQWARMTDGLLKGIPVLTNHH